MKIAEHRHRSQCAHLFDRVSTETHHLCQGCALVLNLFGKQNQVGVFVCFRTNVKRNKGSPTGAQIELGLSKAMDFGLEVESPEHHFHW